MIYKRIYIYIQVCVKVSVYKTVNKSQYVPLFMMNHVDIGIVRIQSKYFDQQIAVATSIGTHIFC